MNPRAFVRDLQNHLSVMLVLRDTNQATGRRSFQGVLQKVVDNLLDGLLRTPHQRILGCSAYLDEGAPLGRQNREIIQHAPYNRRQTD